jgi:hypothetical protein
MAKPNSRQTLIEYCLRALGAPVLEINLDDDQISDRIDEALQFYQEYHSDASIRTYVKHKVTQQDITNEYITVPDALLFISRVFPISAANNTSSNMFSVSYQMSLNDLYGLRNPGDLIQYSMTRQYMSLLDMEFNGLGQTIRFNRHMNRLFVEVLWGDKIQVNDYVIIEGFIVNDPDTFTDIYNDMFLKRYCTALLKKQWGANLIKFEGLQLPGGVTLNGRQIFDDAMAEIEKMETEIESKFQFPPDFYMG